MRKPFYFLFIIILCFALLPFSVRASSVSPSWGATLYAEGQDIGGVNLYQVIIGVGSETDILPAPPPPPEYSVLMELVDVKGSPISKDIRQVGQSRYLWVISLNPHGNINPPDLHRTATLKWDPSEFGAGEYIMSEGFDGAGNIVVDDMKTARSYKIVGTAATYFTVEYIPKKRF